jgi:hypothetical protein
VRRHVGPDFAVSVPDGWTDETVTVLVAPDPDTGEASGANITISRERFEDGETLVGFANRQIAALHAQLDGFTLLAMTREARAGADLVVIEAGWEIDGVTMAQRAALLARPGGSVVVLTCNAPADESERWAGAFDAVMASLSPVGDGETR